MENAREAIINTDGVWGNARKRPLHEREEMDQAKCRLKCKLLLKFIFAQVIGTLSSWQHAVSRQEG